MRSLLPFELVPVLCLRSSFNTYGWLLHDGETNQTLLVDAPELAPLQAVLSARGWRLDAIWLTHHHDDHIQAAEPLAQTYGCPIWGPASEAHRLPPLDRGLKAEDQAPFGRISARCIDVPGHARGQLAYYFSTPGVVFCADSLMSLGCGRLFEGTPEQMWAGLSRLKALPPETIVASGHEIAESNAKFALHVDPNNKDLLSRAEGIKRCRAADMPTVPVSLEEECRTNPFLRVDDPAFKKQSGHEAMEPHTLLGELRSQKDNF